MAHDAARERATSRRRWPKEYGGGGLTPLEQVVLAEEFTKAGVPAGHGNDVFGIQMVGNTILAVGHRGAEGALPARGSSRGEDLWCQGYSEPNAGSDLGNLGCRAELDGDEWVINGQKIWTSAGHLANWIFVLCPHRPRRAEAQGHHVPARARWTSPASRCGRSR